MSRPRQIRAVLMGAYALLLLSTGSTQATLLAPPAVAGQVGFTNPPAGFQVDTLGTFPLSGPNGSLRFRASGTPGPFVAADATMAPFFFGRASGSLVYQMEILGPAGDVPVSITVSGAVTGASVLSSGDLFAGFAMKSLWRFETTSGVPLVPEEGIDTPSLTGSFSQSFGETHELVLAANQVYRVTMTADAGARAASASAFIDPVFSFGPGVGPEYSFQFSDGVGNLPVPEPATVALFGAGIAVICLRRARPNSTRA